MSRKVSGIKIYTTPVKHIFFTTKTSILHPGVIDQEIDQEKQKSNFDFFSQGSEWYNIQYTFFTSEFNHM